ncbi:MULTISPECIES: ABC transporter ATP-binding protein [unclassified Marinobacter]|uniref:ABC transporter ATP-binding protein n=1 Tax=unclassified Marinobacter TaxID=83889 RepID=UPI000BF6837A|nr:MULTISPECIES: ABC transporter ATP-binding protein [unclassified Marinobacter]PFG10231.1 osmoprotectant transport system ATP-binding protein [Marinobacter sp. LV10MA510-1]PFG52159.1 osmoprotectant transport system ATP-binding protein [Marinobacter sp. LV10R520-4]
MIQLENLTRRFGDAVAVSAVNLKVETGEVCVLVGSSGCGKSTTLQMINRLLPISSGNILVNGKDINTLNARELRLSMGYVIQGTGLFPHWTVARNIATVPHLLKWAPQRIQQRTDELLQLLNLEPAQYRNQYPSQLSGGQAQRVGVARALAADPDILLMDEPFGALDAITRDTLQLEVLRIQRQMKKTIVFVTHDIDEALKLASRIAVMDQGRLIQYDTPDNILRHPASTFVENLVGQQDRGLKMLALRQVGQVMTPHIAPGPCVVPEASIYDDDSLRAALSVMLWHNLEQSPVYDRQGVQIGLVTRAQVCGDLA